MNAAKKFDLNIEKVLESWEVHDALREIIANSIDEQTLSRTKEIEIFKEGERWHIRDFGRGLKCEHFTQNESEEKLRNSDKVIGKFGVGLKDALAVFDRHLIEVKIRSKHGEIRLGLSSKEDFPDVKTLHAFFYETTDKNFKGTDFAFEGLKDEAVESAKNFFLKFSDEEPIEKTQYGDVLSRGKQKARIYVHGVRVAEEENFLFSYNVTSLTKKMSKALNRERSNVGRIAYADRVKSMLLDCKGKKVVELLVNDLVKFESGDCHDELKWIEVSVHACKLLNSQGKVVFMTPYELTKDKEMVDRAENDGFEIIPIPENIKKKITGHHDLEGKPMRDLEQYVSEWRESFEFKFIKEHDLTEKERETFEMKDDILKLIGGKPKNVKKILISETMRPSRENNDANGIWEGDKIIIKRDQLKNLKMFAGTLLHEVAHASSGAKDLSIEFENELTEFLGIVSAKKKD